MKNNISVEFTTKVTTLRLTRLVNALTFCELIYRTRQPYLEQNYFRLQKAHSVWLLGGYLYEALHLVDDLAENFGTSHHFRELMRFATFMRPYRDVLAEMNQNPGFTMDWGGGTSEQVCGLIVFDTADLAKSVAGSKPRLPAYDETATIDSKWMYQRLRPLMDADLIQETVPDGLDLFSKMFRLAAVRFIDGEILGMTTEDLGVEA